jgi:hypothetical protein
MSREPGNPPVGPTNPRRTVRLSTSELVKDRLLYPDRALPALVSPMLAGVDLAVGLQQGND